jgi:hypothetical protein
MTLCRLLRVDYEGDITEEQLCQVCLLYCHSHSVNSLTGFLSGVEDHLRKLRRPPLPRLESYKETRAGLTKLFGQIDKAVPDPSSPSTTSRGSAAPSTCAHTATHYSGAYSC